MIHNINENDYDDAKGCYLASIKAFRVLFLRVL